jgi:hypothetical protein
MRLAVLVLALGLAAAGASGCDVSTDTSGASASSAGGSSERCEPSYPDDCLDVNAADYDCEGGEGDGPKYVAGPITVRGSDPFDLDRDGDGTGCDSSY